VLNSCIFSAASGRVFLRRASRLVTFTVATVLPLAAFAQSSQRLRDRDPDLEGSKKLAAELQQANFHYGPFYLLSKIRLSDAGFTESATLPTGDQSGGLSVSVEAPQRLYFVPTRKTVLTFEATPGYSFFSGTTGDESDRDGQFNYLMRGDAHFLFNHLYLDLYGLREDTLRAHVADINRLVTLENDEGGVVGEVKYSSKTSALFSLRFRDTQFPGNRFQPQDRPVSLLDRSERNGRVSMLHRTFPLTALFVAAERSDYTFDRASYKNSRRTWYGAGASYNAGRTQFRLEAGPGKLEFDDPSQHDFSSILGSFTASRTNGRQTYSLAADRDLGFSIFLDNNYFIANVLRAGVSHVATRKLTLRAGSTYERDVYEVPVQGNERRDTISFTSVGFLYNFRRLIFGSDIGWYERRSTFAGDEDEGIRYVLHLSFTP
jgi:hypothetical protein